LHCIGGAGIKHEIQKNLGKNSQFGGQFFSKIKVVDFFAF